ncbi:DUF787 family protein [Borrelia crocidurae]|uniref:Uncharacterized protein n=1 Tax=Borrelia crocidurae (strain Achema) TaxID=1155096 RepID=I0FEG1_BORCA|nr:DUF787 family protein [Borrelia crocidurae]AFI31867.1 Borrelia burgdorferi protein of unknown function (DUF787)-containing protein [Borrelia crocidurae str. Achema]
MPQDTISVKFTTPPIRANEVNYYTPLLLYKTDKIKIEANSKHKLLILTKSSYLKQIDNLQKEGSNGEDEFTAEKEHLTKSITAMFSVGDFSIPSAPLIIYKETEGAKEVKKYLNENQNSFIVLINTGKKDNFKGGDGLAVYRDDYTHFKDESRFFVFATFEEEIKELFKNGSNSKKGIIVIHTQGEDYLHLKFISRYLSEAEIRHSTNPYGMQFTGVRIITDATSISKLRNTNINFYSYLNENGLDGVPAFKEGVDLLGNSIDEYFTYHYLKYEMIKELIKVWNKNNRHNSKLSELQLSGERDNAYTSAIECMLERFITRGLIVDYSHLRLTLSASLKLKLILSVSITYNFSMNGVLLNITTEDIEDFTNRSDS